MIFEKKTGIERVGARMSSLARLLKIGVNTIKIMAIKNIYDDIKIQCSCTILNSEKTKDQPLQSLGFAGPVTIY